MEWSYFNEFVSKEMQKDIKRIFTNGPVERLPFPKTEMYMKPSHLKLAHEGNGLPQWKLYLGFVVRPTIFEWKVLKHLGEKK
jgi:hypothetical protein